MEAIRVYVRVKEKEDLVEVLLQPVTDYKTTDGSVLWESAGEYFLEAYQCGSNPSICSVEKDPRILNLREEITWLILDEIRNNHVSRAY